MEKTICVGAIIRTKGRYLFGKRSKDKSWGANQWDIVGGKVKKNEHLLIALHREVKEETGIEVRNAQELCKVDVLDPNTNTEFEYYIFLVTHSKGEAANMSDEHSELKYFTRRQLSTLDLVATEYLSIIDKIEQGQIT